MISILYNLIFIPVAVIIKSIMKLFNGKLADREKHCKETVSNLVIPADKTKIWFHASSMGEFEQTKPIIELIKENNPDIFIIVTFFSPSGYNNQKNYPYADAISYMPFDTKSNARKFLDIIKPDMAVFVRYEIWRNYLSLMKNRNIPVYLICATMPGSSALKSFPVLKQFTKSNYNLFSKIYTVSETHSQYFNNLNISPEIITASDTRFDRIIKNIENGKSNAVLPDELFEADVFNLVMGSSWPPDEDIIIPSVEDINKEYFRLRMILVPHEPTEAHLKELSNKINKYILLSELIEKSSNPENIKGLIADKHIVVDSIGKLLSLYRHADAAYIGGAFGAGVHSVTEPAGYGIPLSTGTGYHNSPDAVNLVNQQVITVLNSREDSLAWLNKLLENLEWKEETGQKAKKYVYDAQGSSRLVYDDVLRVINS